MGATETSFSLRRRKIPTILCHFLIGHKWHTPTGLRNIANVITANTATQPLRTTIRVRRHADELLDEPHLSITITNLTQLEDRTTRIPRIDTSVNTDEGYTNPLWIITIREAHGATHASMGDMP